MEDIFEIKFPIEVTVKNQVILKFSNKQGGSYNIFSYYWQCFVWAATIGFLRNERRPLSAGTEKIFNLNTIRGNGGEKDAQALLCMCIARCGTVDIMKNPSDAIMVISEYANGGFYHILNLMENGENTFNDLEKVKQEIFSRDYRNVNTLQETIVEDLPCLDGNAMVQAEEDFFAEDVKIITRTKRWLSSEKANLKSYYKQGMTIEQLAGFFECGEDDIYRQLKILGIIK